MAIAAGSQVLMVSASADYPELSAGPAFCPQPPTFGIAVNDAGGGAWDVLWSTGELSTGIPDTYLSELFDVSSASRDAYWGRIVSIANESPEYTGEVISMYRRGGAANAERALVYISASDSYREVLVSQLVIVGGR